MVAWWHGGVVGWWRSGVILVEVKSDLISAEHASKELLSLRESTEDLRGRKGCVEEEAELPGALHGLRQDGGKEDEVEAVDPDEVILVVDFDDFDLEDIRHL